MPILEPIERKMANEWFLQPLADHLEERGESDASACIRWLIKHDKKPDDLVGCGEYIGSRWNYGISHGGMRTVLPIGQFGFNARFYSQLHGPTRDDWSDCIEEAIEGWSSQSPS